MTVDSNSRQLDSLRTQDAPEYRKRPPTTHRLVYPIPAFRQVRPRDPWDASQTAPLAGTPRASTHPLPRAVTPIPCRMPGTGRGRAVHWAVRGTAVDDAGRCRIIITIRRVRRERRGGQDARRGGGLASGMAAGGREPPSTTRTEPPRRLVSYGDSAVCRAPTPFVAPVQAITATWRMLTRYVL